MNDDLGLMERLHLAVNHLATGKGELRERAVDAYSDHLEVLIAKQFTGKAREIFERLNQTISAILAKIANEVDPAILDATGSFHYAKTIQYLHPRLARRLATMICELRDEVDFAREEALSEEIERLRELAKQPEPTMQ
jgi:hypothetical protein